MLEKSTYYILDAQGNQMAMYDHKVNAEATVYYLAERNIYGSSRLGTTRDTVNMYIPNELPSYGVVGNRNYELSNHLGNVLTVISDHITPLDEDNNEEVDGYQVSIAISADYSPFGVQLDGRTFESENYRYGFNSMEKDDELKSSEGTSYDFGARMYDPRVGRFLSVDPSFAIQPSEGVYNFAGNSPILYIDYNGHFKWPGTEEEQKALENKYPKFTKIMQNIHKMPEMYDNLLDEMSKQSGISKEEIANNLKYGNGATIVINSTVEGMRTPNISEIQVNEKLLDDFEHMAGEDLDIATVAIAISLLHEEVHRGDRITNKGNITGQFEYMQFGKYVVGKAGDILEGKQKDAKISKFGHRGSDLEVSVFGAPNDPKMKMYDNDRTKLMNTGGYTLTIDKWNSDPKVKSSEQGALISGLGIAKINETSKMLKQ